jgi:hypothetical protein
VIITFARGPCSTETSSTLANQLLETITANISYTCSAEDYWNLDSRFRLAGDYVGDFGSDAIPVTIRLDMNKLDYSFLDEPENLNREVPFPEECKVEGLYSSQDSTNKRELFSEGSIFNYET